MHATGFAVVSMDRTELREQNRTDIAKETFLLVSVPLHPLL